MIKRKLFSVIAFLLVLSFCFSGCAVVIEDNAPAKGEQQEIRLGKGEKQFLLTVTNDKGEEAAYRINTDKSTVGEALLELKIIEGEEGPYGMYIKTVNGLTADFNDGGKYWAFYVNGEYATAGVDKTVVENNFVYSLKVQK